MANYLAVDIGGTYIKYSLVSPDGRIRESNKTETPQDLPAFRQALRDLTASFSERVAGVGVSCPGRVDSVAGIVYKGGVLTYLDGFSFRDFFGQEFTLPCAVVNDGKAAALAEYWLGNLQGAANGAAIVLGTGVGGGLIVDGRLLQGSHFQAGELSFLPRKAQHGDMDNLMAASASAVNFVKSAARLLGLDDELDGQAVFAAIDKGGNPALEEHFRAYCREIVHIILSLQAVLDIDKVVIGGGISAQPILLDTVREEYRTLRRESGVLHLVLEDAAIDLCRFSNEANQLGAVYQLLHGGKGT